MSRQTGSDLIDRWEAVGALWDMTTEDCPNPGAAVGKCMEFIKAMPSAEPSWTDVLAELHDRFNALEKELRKASAEMSAVIREYVDRPQGEWMSEGRTYPPTNAYHSAYCSHCGEWSEYLTDYCGNCGADMREREGE